MKRNTVLELIIILNIILFSYTGIAKIQDYTIFKEQLTENPVFRPVSKTISVLLPIAEFIVVIMLAIPRWRLIGLYLTIGLMLLFTGYIIVLLSTNNKIPCSCGGIIEELSWQQHLLLNGILILLNLFAIRHFLKDKINRIKELNSLNKYKILHS